MWICRHCDAAVKAGETDAEHDEDGFYFRCRRCQCRNRLIDAARRDVGSAVGLVQPDP
jgi:hypothetical protein